MVKKVAGIGKVVEGYNSVFSAIESNRVKKIIYLETGNANSDRLKKLIDLANSKGLGLEKISTKNKWVYSGRHTIVALCDPKETYNEKNLDKLNSSNIAVLDHIQDTNNVGAIARSASAFNFNIICLPKKRSVNITERTFSISSGGLENVDIVFYNSIFSLIKKLKSLNYWTIGLEMNAEENISNDSFNDQKVALFIGSEESGLSVEVQKKLDLVLKINMNDTIESLNASVAAGIAMSYFFKKNS